MSAPASAPTEVLLVGNYAPDRQRSMERCAEQIAQHVANDRWKVRWIKPAPFFNRLRPGNKWLGYLDKYLVFGVRLWWLTHRPGARLALVHIADHSNAMYVFRCASVPVIVTVHDLLAVRAGLGEDGTACRPSRLGVVQQKWILGGLRRATALAAVSETTAADIRRLGASRAALTIIPNPVGPAFRVLPEDEARVGTSEAGLPADNRPFLFCIGSALPRKNRASVIRIFEAMRRSGWDGRLVFAGAGKAVDIEALVDDSAFRGDILFLGSISEPHLVALYNRAHCLLFPSFSEGFGWPCIEAGACACPVIASNTTSLPEVCGRGGQLFEPEDVEGMARAALRLSEPAERTRWARAARENASLYTLERLAENYRDLYAMHAGPIATQ